MAIALSITSCTDTWDDHYNIGSTYGGNLWESISTNPELSNFANVVKACGYDASLASSQMFTVFAPTNANFSDAQAQELISVYQQEKNQNIKNNDNTAIKEFLQNHIALYNYSVSGNSNDSIVMMNGKYMSLTSNSLGGQSMTLAGNVGNGVLYTLDKKVDYSPNVFEYLKKDAEIDSVANFLYEFNQYVFDPALSVPGEIKDGQTHYLDSVSVLENEMFSHLAAKLASEDSTSWMVVPTNDEWNRLVPEYEKYYQYDNSVAKRDSMQYVNARLALLRGTIFSRTQNPDRSVRDSAMSTSSVIYELRDYVYGSADAKYYQYDRPYDAGGVFTETEDYECSNGKVMKTSKWKIDKKQTFLQSIICEGEDNARLDSVDQLTTNTPLTIVRVAQNNPYYGKLSNNRYAEITPARGAASNIKAVFNVPTVLSNIGYDIYITTAPALAGDTLATDASRLPTKFRVRMAYNDVNGRQPSKESEWTVLQKELTTTADEVDCFKVAENVQIPYCSAGGEIAPQVKLILDTRVSNNDVKNGKFNRILRIDSIVFKPHEEE